VELRALAASGGTSPGCLDDRVDQTDHDGGLSPVIGVPGGDIQTHSHTLLPER
jgi:hypothetical protein